MSEHADELAALLGVARSALMDEIAPLVPPERRYALLMIGNALGIAAREVETGDAPVTDALGRLLALYDEEPTPGEAAEAELDRLEWRLSEDIRAGVHDSGTGREAAAAYLAARTRARTAISNPRYLDAPP